MIKSYMFSLTDENDNFSQQRKIDPPCNLGTPQIPGENSLSKDLGLFYILGTRKIFKLGLFPGEV